MKRCGNWFGPGLRRGYLAQLRRRSAEVLLRYLDGQPHALERLRGTPSCQCPFSQHPRTLDLCAFVAGSRSDLFWKRRKFFSLISGDSLAWSCAGRAGTHGVAVPRPRLLIRGAGVLYLVIMKVTFRFTAVTVLFAAFTLASTTQATVVYDLVPVGDPGNAADVGGFGSVAY